MSADSFLLWQLPNASTCGALYHQDFPPECQLAWRRGAWLHPPQLESSPDHLKGAHQHSVLAHRSLLPRLHAASCCFPLSPPEATVWPDCSCVDLALCHAWLHHANQANTACSALVSHLLCVTFSVISLFPLLWLFHWLCLSKAL